MSEFHYVRILGSEGGVDAVEGQAVGLDLDTLMQDGLPPYKVVLEIISALCEILDISDQDGEVHGDVATKFIFLDETGAVSLEGFGVDRPVRLAPEGKAHGVATDLYGLGSVLFKMLSGKELPSNLPRELGAHDDAVIDAIVSVGYDGLPEEIVGDVQWFLAKLLAFDPDERPTPVDVWRTFIAFADTVAGATLNSWSNAALSGGGQRRAIPASPAASAPLAAAPLTPSVPDEDLGGPVVARGPLSKGGINFDGGAGKNKQATAFWSRDQMKAALDAEEDEEEYKPAIGGGSATSFWSKDQMDAMRSGKADAPRPKRKSSGRTATTFMERPKTAVIAQDAAAGLPSNAQRPSAPLPRPGGPVVSAPATPAATAVPSLLPPPVGFSKSAPPVLPPSVLPPPVLPPSALPPPVVPARSAPSPSASLGSAETGIMESESSDESALSKRSSKWIGIAVVAVLLLVCGGVSLFGVIWMFMERGGESAAPVAAEKAELIPDEQRVTEPSPNEDAEEKSVEPGPPPPPPEEMRAKPAREERATPPPPAPKPSVAPKPAPTPKAAPAPKASPVPSVAPVPKPVTSPSANSSVRPGSSSSRKNVTSGPARVSFKSSGRGKITCGDGTNQAFDGSASLEFDSSALPVNCMVTIEKKKSVFSVERSMSVTCDLAGDEVTCN